MSWKPKAETGLLKFTAPATEGLEIKYRKAMTIRELSDIQKMGTQDERNMQILCGVLASKIIAWNYDEKPSADALLDLPHDVVTDITTKLMEAIVGNADDKNLAEPSPNGLSLEEVSGVMGQ